MIGLLPGTGRFWLIAFEHEGHEVIPVIERQVVQECAQMFKEGAT